MKKQIVFISLCIASILPSVASCDTKKEVRHHGKEIRHIESRCKAVENDIITIIDAIEYMVDYIEELEARVEVLENMQNSKDAHG